MLGSFIVLYSLQKMRVLADLVRAKDKMESKYPCFWPSIRPNTRSRGGGVEFSKAESADCLLCM